jgi:hypothetical protein
VASTNGRKARGAALPLAMILLAALTAIGVAAVSLATIERRNAAAYYHIDAVQECANAARAKIYAEMAQYGMAYLGASVAVTDIRLPDGTRVESPAHYDSRSGGVTPIVKDVVVTMKPMAGEAMAEQDCTNSACGIAPPGTINVVTAHCTDTQGREFEIEAGIKFAL